MTQQVQDTSSNKIKLFIGSDHAAYELKSLIISHIQSSFPQYDIIDVGTHSQESCDYPTFGHLVGENVVKQKGIGITICGTGIGISISANKVRGIRCALCHDVTTARLCKQHNNANVLALGARIVGVDLAKDIVSTFLTTPFSEEERHQKRIDLIEKIES
ncbi:MAG: Ribose-5-phosphate isomerase [Streblomastix strix]|uniref:Ribose-5-phosphate isomerase n=1 Tax=Streblomastix strix TaxID=222440 RepID=A0A5J4X3C9_9EUKA|nr:MAG: Ribose-5-phosphate isomerase [Streblomastix strix]